MKIKVSDDKKHFLANGKPTFLLGDTCWSAFTHPSMEEWVEYLDFRREQNFNAIQMNLLQQRHSCEPRKWLHPFAITEENRYNYSLINDDYFDHVCLYLEEMIKRSMVPMVVLLWGNYVPGTWQGILDAGRENIFDKPYYLPMNDEEMENYIVYAVNRLKKYDPIFLISGDVNLSLKDIEKSWKDNFLKANPETVEFYGKALRITKENAPDCLNTLHIAPEVELPDCLIESSYLDFYMYQPGHYVSKPNLNRTLAQNIRNYQVKRPIYNSETSYEANIYFDYFTGRFDERQVRRAFWHGMLSGAQAGFTYGAGGVWLWRNNWNCCSIANDTGYVNNWRDDIHLPGAFDVSFGREIVENLGIYYLDPVDLPMENPNDEMVASASPDRSKVVIYLPFSYPLKLRLNLEEYDVKAIDLETRNVLRPTLTKTEYGTLVGQLRYNHDYLIILRRE